MPEFSSNSSISSETREAVLTLDAFASRTDVKAKLNQAREDVLRKLLADTFQHSSAFGIDLAEFENIPNFLGTLRVAGFRAGFEAQNEVHPNSDQFTLTLAGRGRTIVEVENGFRTDRYGVGYGDSLHSKWHFAPREQFHQHIAGESEIWIVAAFHTAHEVITNYR